MKSRVKNVGANSPRAKSAWGLSAFTLVELLIVVSIIGMLCSMALPSFRKVSLKTKATLLANDLRVAKGIINTYVMEKGQFPPDGAWGFPTELDDYIPNSYRKKTPIGGKWDWDFSTTSSSAAMSIFGVTTSPADMTVIDSLIDDGNTLTGAFRRTANGYSYFLEP